MRKVGRHKSKVSLECATHAEWELPTIPGFGPLVGPCENAQTSEIGITGERVGRPLSFPPIRIYYPGSGLVRGHGWFGVAHYNDDDPWRI